MTQKSIYYLERDCVRLFSMYCRTPDIVTLIIVLGVVTMIPKMYFTRICNIA